MTAPTKPMGLCISGLIAAWAAALLGRGSLLREDKGHLGAEHCPRTGPP